MGKRDEFEDRASECDKKGHNWHTIYDDDGEPTGAICTRCSMTK